MRRILLEGRPGIGKTTVARRLAAMLREAGIPVSGFTTEEMREDGARVGFRIETLAGEEGILAHVRFSGPPRVGKYGVDLEALERLALPALHPSDLGAVAIVDELGKMELASGRFRSAIAALFEADVPVVATVHSHRHPFTDVLKGRPGVSLVAVTRDNRELLPERLAEALRDR